MTHNQIHELERELAKHSSGADDRVEKKTYEALREQLQAQELRAAAESARLAKELAALQVSNLDPAAT